MISCILDGISSDQSQPLGKYERARVSNLWFTLFAENLLSVRGTQGARAPHANLVAADNSNSELLSVMQLNQISELVTLSVCQTSCTVLVCC